MTSFILKVSVQNVSSPKVSKRKMSLPIAASVGSTVALAAASSSLLQADGAAASTNRHPRTADRVAPDLNIVVSFQHQESEADER